MDLLALVTVSLCLVQVIKVDVAADRTSVRVLAPPVVRRGSTVTLLCLHNLTAEELYSVKWYRGNYEFYRFVPKERPPASVFRLPGLEVEMAGSHGQQVTVRILSRHISGRFTCEVSAEEPSFSTSSDSVNISVIDIGLRKPLLLPSSSVHEAGSLLQVNCSAQLTVPQPDIAFYIDDVKVERGLVRLPQPGLAVLELRTLSETQGPGPVWLRCEASVPGMYHLSSASIPVLELLSRQDSSGTAVLTPVLDLCLALQLMNLARSLATSIQTQYY